MSDYYDGLLKLSEMTGKKVVDVVGRVSHEFGDATFLIVAVKFEGGSYESCGGEHDFPYVECEVPEKFNIKEE